MSKPLDDLQQQLEQIEPSGQNVSKGTQILLGLKYRELAQRGVILAFEEVEFRNFSQTGEDGILHYIYSLIGAGSRRSVEICAGVGSECNSANLILNHSWYSLLIDGREENVQQGIEFFAGHPDSNIMGPSYLHRWVSVENVNSILQEQGFDGEIDLLSLDMDGVDYWIWDAISIANPRVVVAEVMPQLGDAAVTVPYAQDFKAEWIPLFSQTQEDLGKEKSTDKSFWSRWTMYAGASLAAFNKLAGQKGYRLIGANNIGFNAFFMRDDVGVDEFPQVSEASCHNPNYRKRFALAAEKLKDHSLQQV